MGEPSRATRRRVAVAVALVAGLVAAAAIVSTGRGDRGTTSVGLGQPVGVLRLVDLDGRPVTVPGASDTPVTVLWFWSVLCECVEQCEERIVALRRDHGEEGLRLLAIDSSDDSPEEVRALARRLGSPYEVLLDPGAREAARLGVRASASVVVLDAEGRIVYRGAIDDDLDRPTISYVRRAMEVARRGEAMEPAEVPSYGCRYPVAAP